MKLHVAAAALALLASTAAIAQQKLNPAQSEIAFTSKQMGVPVEGRFRKFDAQVAFDPKQPQAAKKTTKKATPSAMRAPGVTGCRGFNG
jgi:polyisoprenoid-binding protein YceI